MKKFKKILVVFLILIIVAITILYISGYSTYKKAISQTPIIDKVAEVQTSKDFVSFDALPKNLINATIAVEDHRYYEHKAIDPIGITRALFSNIKANDAVEGGSTIQQQTAKNLYFMSEKDGINRKIAELIVSYQLSKNYKPEQILELYVNTIYYGNGYYGIKQAAKGYYNKEPKDLTLDECTLLAGVPNAPSVYAPTANIDLCISRQKKVIRSMVQYGYLSQAEADKIKVGYNK